MAEQNILSADQSVLEQILSDINEHEENQERLEHIAASIKDITRETDSTTKAMEEEISSRIKESTDSICAGYDKAIACDKDKIKQVQAERDKAKMQGIKERIQTETASLREENKELAGQIEKAFIQENVLRIMQSHDLLILPSMYDGWGAVINEALQQGMRVLCSDRCGASCLLDGIHRGGTFSWNEKGSLERELRHWISKGPITQKERTGIASWAKTTISGQAPACYLTSILSFIQGKTSSRPLPPWQDKI